MTSSSRFVLDTNVLISAALIPEGKPHKVLARVLESGVLLFSPQTFDELETRIYRPRFHKYLKTDRASDYILLLRQRATLLQVETGEKIEVCRDPDDNRFLELAVIGEADYLISGDADLLVLHPFRGIPILTPAQFLAGDPKGF